VVAIWAAAFSTDPELVGEVTDLVGLYVNPPLQPGLAERRSTTTSGMGP
jgi:hypothetical protein